ncbi:RNA polymerase sigma factor [Zunongwangia atlantica]|uniref:RNA polymerase sigma factor n=1 Tax=Zunongwangia atlantica 22II14-10F7 TaxID=1185767 RepID=A0A1Y1T8K3_9FLAO|nr:RNA polymerase sigma factor [Zunongwangia atlantica]ORL47386.1 RNA polymerase sigma factor [Zunongwangia atlantica 22II14-10F7]
MSKKLKFQKIYDENYPKVIRLCLGYLSGNEALAQDMAQEVFIKVWQYLKDFRGDSNISTWIYRITVNTCLQELRKKKNKSLKIEIASNEASEVSEIENQFASMYRCIDKLSAENKSIILLELEGLPQKEIAEVIGINHSAVRTRIHRIKDQLSKCVKNE